MSGTDGTHGNDDWDGGAGTPLETEQLALAGESDRLPWLESSDDDDFVDAGNGGLIRLVVVGLVVLAVLIGAIWWATRRGPDNGMLADGSLIPAEPGPYKEAPKDPGGKQFDGTGDTSFAVSEGQNRPAHLAATDAPAPPAAAASAQPAPRPSASASPVAPNGGLVGVQVGAYSSKTAAEAGWTKLVAQSNGALSGVSHRVIEGTADNGTIYRLQAVAGNSAAATALCGKLKASGLSCQVK